VRKVLSLLIIVFAITSGCKHIENNVVAEAFHQKLYMSEVMENLPYAITKEDSLFFMEKHVDEWILRKTLLAKAKQSLTPNEMDFSDQIEALKEQLLINAYFQKIERDSMLFEVSKQEIADFLDQTTTDKEPEYRDMVKLNYIKLSNPSKLYKQIKELFFEEKNRVKTIEILEMLCADTIEYYLDNEHWLYVEYLEDEFPLKFSNVDKDTKNRFDIVQKEYRYLIFILDKKKQLLPKNSSEDIKIVQRLFQQQKRTAFFTNFQDSIAQKALRDKKAIRYPMGL